MFRNHLVAPIAATALCLSAIADSSGLTLAQSAPPAISADWPLPRGDAARRGEGAEGPLGQPVLRWRYQAQGAVNATVTIVGDLAYASSDDGVLHALDLASGEERWSWSPDHTPVSGPALADGAVFAFDGTGTLFALDAASGHELWHAAAPIDGPSNPTIADGSLFVGTASGGLAAVDTTTGGERWRSAIASAGAVHSPAYAEGVVYVGSDSGGFVAVDAATGKLVWHVDTGTDQTGTAVVADGIAYVGATDAVMGHLRALDAHTGTLLWEDADPLFSPAVSDGVAYSGSGSGLVAALDTATGEELWRSEVQGTARGTAVAQGVVYVPADQEHRVYALDAAAGRELWRFEVDGSNDGGIGVAHGSVFVGTVLGGVYDIGGDDSAASPGSSPAAVPSPVETVPTPSAAASPMAGAVPVEFLWSAKGGPDGMNFPNDMALDPAGRLWVADTSNGRFAIFDSDGTFVESWGTKGKGDGQFNLQRSNGDCYGAIAFAPDGSFYVLDVGNRRVQHFDADRQFLGSWVGFGTDPGHYNDPVGLAVDEMGVVHVLDDVRDVVERYDADGNVLGSFAPHLAGLNSANSLALDAQGNAHISACCAAGNQVEVFDASGSPLITIGSPGSGDGRFSDQPSGLAVDAAGRLFVSQGGVAPNVQIFGADGGYLGKLGGPGGDHGQFTFPFGVILDGQGNVYVTDAGSNQVDKFRLLPPFAP